MALGKGQRSDIGIVSGKGIRNDISKKALRKDIAGISSGNVSGKDIGGMASGEGQRNDIGIVSGKNIRNDISKKILRKDIAGISSGNASGKNIRRAGQILSGEG